MNNSDIEHSLRNTVRKNSFRIFLTVLITTITTWIANPKMLTGCPCPDAFGRVQNDRIVFAINELLNAYGVINYTKRVLALCTHKNLPPPIKIFRG